MLAIGAWTLAGGALAESRAFLVGVGRYAKLPSDYSLAAPALDVARLGGALRAAGLSDSAIRTVSDAAEPTGATRAAILQGLDELARGSVAGDKVLIYFSGHGGRRPSRTKATERDGLEEVWLASDATVNADGEPETGVIADHEIVAAVEALRLRGVDVWLVVDACYGAGAMRGGATGQGVVKTVSRNAPVALRSNGLTGRGPGFGAVSGQKDMGAFVGFYAAADDGLAVATDRGSVFSNALARSLDAGRTRSLRDLAAGVLSADGRLGPDAPRPVFEGDLEGPVLDLLVARPRRFALSRRGSEVAIAAGVEEGLATGDRLLLENEGGDPIGYGSVARAGIGRSVLEGAAPSAASGRLTPPDMKAGTAAARVMAAIAALSGGWTPQTLSIATRLDRSASERCDAPVDVETPPDAAAPVSLFALPELKACDRLYVEITNDGRAPVDVNLLYLSATGEVVGPSLHPVDSVRLAPGERRSAALRITAESTTVTEHLAILALPAATRFPADLRYLSGAAARPDRGDGYAKDDGLSVWLAEVLDGRPRRGEQPGPPPGQAFVAVAFPITVRP